jgi:hypothetical protein
MPLWGKTDTEDNRPSFLKDSVDSDGIITSGPYEGKRLVFIDEAEAAKTSNISKGITSTGWYAVETRPNTRTRAELLVAISDAPGSVADESEPVEDDANIDTED